MQREKREKDGWDGIVFESHRERIVPKWLKKRKEKKNNNNDDDDDDDDDDDEEREACVDYKIIYSTK